MKTIIEMAREVKMPYDFVTGEPINLEKLKAFEALVRADERNKLAAWMIAQGYATGHGDTIEQLLEELRWQVEERGQDAP
jgi:hypothetical protein